MRQMAIHTGFNAFSFAIFEISSALVIQKIQRAIAKHTIKCIFVLLRMAREILTFAIGKKFVTVVHIFYNALSVVS